MSIKEIAQLGSGENGAVSQQYVDEIKDDIDKNIDYLREKIEINEQKLDKYSIGSQHLGVVVILVAVLAAGAILLSVASMHLTLQRIGYGNTTRSDRIGFDTPGNPDTSDGPLASEYFRDRSDRQNDFNESRWNRWNIPEDFNEDELYGTERILSNISWETMGGNYELIIQIENPERWTERVQEFFKSHGFGVYRLSNEGDINQPVYVIHWYE